MEIEEGNKLIAAFEGRSSKEYFGRLLWSVLPGEVCLSDWWEIEELDYDCNWNLLMPVVEKIESMGTIIEIWMALGRGCRITKGGFKEPIKTIATTESNSTIEAVWMAVIEFIKWYRHGLTNNQTLKNENRKD